MKGSMRFTFLAIALLIGTSSAIKSMDDCQPKEAEKVALPDGEYYGDGEHLDDVVIDQVHLSMHDSLGFDVRVLLAPCVDYQGIQWYITELKRWEQAFSDPVGTQADFQILREVKDLMVTARDKINEQEEVPVQTLIQLKIRALSKIKDINTATSLIGEEIEKIAQMVELMNKAQDH